MRFGLLHITGVELIALIALTGFTYPAAAASPQGINSLSGPLPIGAGGNGPFIVVNPSGQVDINTPAGNPSMRAGQNGTILFLTASQKKSLEINADGALTFYLAKNSASPPVRFINPYNNESIGEIQLTGPGPSSTGIFYFPNLQAKTNNGPAGVFRGKTTGIMVSTENGSAGSFTGAKGSPAIYATTPWDNGDWAGHFYGDNGILAKPHRSTGLAGWFQGDVKISANLTVGGVSGAGVPVGVVTVGGAEISNSTVLTANSLRDNVLDNCFSSNPTGTGVVTKTGPNRFTCTTIIPGAGATGPAGPPGPPGAVADFDCGEGNVLQGLSGGLPICVAARPEIISQSGIQQANKCAGNYVGGYCESQYYTDVTFPKPFPVVPKVIVSPALISDQGGAIGYATDQTYTRATDITTTGFRMWCSGSPETDPYEGWSTVGLCSWLAVIP